VASDELTLRGPSSGLVTSPEAMALRGVVVWSGLRKWGMRRYAVAMML